MWPRILRVLEAMPRGSNSVGMFLLVPLMLLTAADVFMRLLFDQPILGTVELSEFMLVCIVWLGLAYGMARKKHISIELLVSRFSPRVQTYFDIFTCLAGLTVMALVAWVTAGMTVSSREAGEAGDISHFPYFPFKGVIAVGAILFILEVIRELVLHIARLRRKPAEEGKEE